jgi:hypothetical protein
MQSRSKQQLDSNTSGIIQLHLAGIPSGFSVIQNRHAREKMYTTPFHKSQTKPMHRIHTSMLSFNQMCNSQNTKLFLKWNPGVMDAINNM